jgi:hypothetical protein
MLIRIFVTSVLMLIGASIHSSIGAEARDYPDLGRIQGYKISSYNDKRFDRVNLPPPVEGHVIRFEYQLDGSEPAASAVEIARSYKTVIEGLGGETLSYKEEEGDLVGRFRKNDQNVYVLLDARSNGWYVLTVVEERPFRSMIQKSAPSSQP